MGGLEDALRDTEVIMKHAGRVASAGCGKGLGLREVVKAYRPRDRRLRGVLLFFVSFLLLVFSERESLM